MHNLQGLLFDLDQTLLDRSLSLRLFLDNQWKETGALQRIPQHLFVDTFIDLDDNGRVWKDVVYDRLLKRFGVKDAQAPLLCAEYVADFSRHATLFPDALETLRMLKNEGLKLGIITNGRTELQSSVMRSTGLELLMDVILISEAEAVKKPEPEIFKRALDRLGLEAPACVFIGDAPDADIKGAHAAGLKTIWKKNAHFPPPEHEMTSAVFNAFKTLPSALEKLSHIAYD